MTVRRIGTRKDALRRFADASLAAALPGGASLYPIPAQVDGYLFPQEAVFLYWLARSGPGDGAIVEIGSYRGRSTLCLATGVKGRRTTRIVAVDPHVYGTEEQLRENLAHFGMSEIVRPIVAPSVAAASAWTGPVRVVFVDGHHEQASVEADVDAWLPFLTPGGLPRPPRFDGSQLVSGPRARGESAALRRHPLRCGRNPRWHDLGQAHGRRQALETADPRRPWPRRGDPAGPDVGEAAAPGLACCVSATHFTKPVARTEFSACIHSHVGRWGVRVPGGESVGTQ